MSDLPGRPQRPIIHQEGAFAGGSLRHDPHLHLDRNWLAPLRVVFGTANLERPARLRVACPAEKSDTPWRHRHGCRDPRAMRDAGSSREARRHDARAGNARARRAGEKDATKRAKLEPLRCCASYRSRCTTGKSRTRKTKEQPHCICSPLVPPPTWEQSIQHSAAYSGQADRLSNPRAHIHCLVTPLSGQSGRPGLMAKLSLYTRCPDNPDCPDS